MKFYEQQYSINPPRGASWYATLNIVFAIGSLAATVGQRGSTPETAFNDEADRWNFTDYFRNSCCVLGELMFESHNVLAVQALIGISFILESTMDVQATFTVIGAAVRIAHTIGLYRKILRPENYGLSVAESNQRRNTFWTLYIIEKSLAIRLGRLLVISDDDIDVPLPEYSDNFDPSQDVDDKLDTFYHQVMLSRIEIHRAPAHVALWTMKPSSSDELKRTKAAVHHCVSASHLHCIDAACNTAQLLSHFDRQDMIPKGVLLHLVVFYPLSAFLTLFANILENLNDSYVDSDVGLMNMIEKFLLQAAEERFETPRVMVKRVFAKLTSITAKFLARNVSRSRPVKRGHEDLTNEPLKSEPISSNKDPILKQTIDEALQPLNFSHMDYIPYNDSDVPSYHLFDPLNTFEFTPDRLDFSIPTLSSPFISLDPRDFDWGQLMFTGKHDCSKLPEDMLKGSGLNKPLSVLSAELKLLSSVRIVAPVTTSHSFTVLSLKPDATTLPSSEKATDVTDLEWPSSVCIAAPPSGEKATALTDLEWPSSVCIAVPEPNRPIPRA
ncbi:hypothetical protein V502_03488 [Pseudogymnoascus sp. VKM F-4520 (FW-2644)]|nr:hypothetical protein V502_03488 [Pseudogymnoascus sp. VKM F-4520 (FW-2644)]